MQYEDLVERLMPEALDLFRRVATVHLAVGAGEREFIHNVSGLGHTIFRAPDGSTMEGVDSGALSDLTGYGLLRGVRSSRTSTVYAVPGEGIRFFKWLMERQGLAVQQAEAAVVSHVYGDPGFISRHPHVAATLRDCLEILWTGDLSEIGVSRLGDTLRKALFDLVSDLLGDDITKRETPMSDLKAAVSRLSTPKRQQAVLGKLAEYAAEVLRLDHRLAHVRDEADLGKPEVSWEEARHSAFATVYVCYELDRAFRSEGQAN